MARPEDMSRRPNTPEVEGQKKPDFIVSLEAKWDRNLFLCVGLDPDLNEFKRLAEQYPDVFGRQRVPDPQDSYAERFLEGRIKDVISATSDIAAVYKPNSAFYEQYGDLLGDNLLFRTMSALAEVPNILDIKRGDIGNTQEAYARAAFEGFSPASAVTVNPYMSDDAVLPFARYENKGVFPLVRTSNPSAAKTQDVRLADGRAYWELIAEMARDDWNENGNIGIVMGATNRSQLLRAREIVGSDMPILAPGVGRQGGSIEDVVAAGNRRFVINVSRSIMYPPLEPGETYIDGVRRSALGVNGQIQTALKAA